MDGDDGVVRRRLVLTSIAAGMLAVIYATIYLTAEWQLTRLLPRAVAEAVGGQEADRYAVRVGDVRLSPLLTGVSIEELSISVDTMGAEGAVEPALVRNASFRSLQVSGLRLIPLLRGAGLVVAGVELDRPSLVLDFAAVQGSSSAPAEGSHSDEVDDEEAAPEQGASIT